MSWDMLFPRFRVRIKRFYYREKFHCKALAGAWVVQWLRFDPESEPICEAAAARACTYAHRLDSPFLGRHGPCAEGLRCGAQVGSNYLKPGNAGLGPPARCWNWKSLLGPWTGAEPAKLWGTTPTFV
ncbi:hypothetical protein CRG98_014396 [Punica granatum]|uniref:Uncharacterized protein n=1 Tax=Punica granatum TaxID=22663 RepID=A0A2I0K9L7_PUNGR|nr:hypothetical protein CRG98_014396 [Punica granatum]